MFEEDRIDRTALFAPAIQGVTERVPQDEPVVVIIDDTLTRKRGKKVAGTSWKRDPLGPRFQTNFVWAQRFLQLSAALPDTAVHGRARAIPIDFIHAPSPAKPRKTDSTEAWDEYRKEQKVRKVSAVASGRLQKLQQQIPDRNIVCVFDGAFTNTTMFGAIPKGTVLIGRIRKDARLYEVPRESHAGPGRKRTYGDPLPTPEEIRKDDTIPWQKVEAFAAGKRHCFDVKTLPCVRWRSSKARNVRLVVVRPLAYCPRKGAKLLYRDPAYFICSDPDLPLDKLLQAYLWRWEIELNFRDEKTVFGVGEAQVRLPTSVQNVPALLVAAYAFLLLAADDPSSRSAHMPTPKWNPRAPSDRPSTQQLLALYRSQIWRLALGSNKTHFASSHPRPRSPFYSNNSPDSAIFFARK